MKYFIVLLLILQSVPGISQNQADSLLLIQERWIDFKLLKGEWRTVDTSKYTIEFVDSNYEATLNMGSYSHPYYFLKNNQSKISSSGYYPNWPPFSCELSLINEGYLEISFSQIGVPTYTLKFKKLP